MSEHVPSDASGTRVCVAYFIVYTWIFTWILNCIYRIEILGLLDFHFHAISSPFQSIFDWNEICTYLLGWPKNQNINIHLNSKKDDKNFISWGEKFNFLKLL